MATTEHIPAWKRLGLKLKYAKDDAGTKIDQEDVPQIENHQPLDTRVSYEKKRSIDSHEDVPAVSKRQKLPPRDMNTNEIPHRNHHHNNFVNSTPSANDRFTNSIYRGRPRITKTPQKIVFEDDLNIKESAHTLSRKKSVSFTPETKVEDGASGQEFAKLWLAPQTTVEAAVQETPTKQSTKKISKPKKEKSRQQTTKEKLNLTEPEERTACIKYLDQFHTDKVNWKFNKSRQNDLVRHLWSVEVIPPASNDAIVAYISGLQGAAARQRVLEGAMAILKPLLEKHKEGLGELDMTSKEGQRDAYMKAVQKQLELLQSTTRSEPDAEILKELQQETRQAERAELLLRKALWQEMGIGEPIVETIVETDAKDEDVTANKSKRKSRKSRTAVDSSSDSSSSSESDSDSDSDED